MPELSIADMRELVDLSEKVDRLRRVKESTLQLRKPKEWISVQGLPIELGVPEIVALLDMQIAAWQSNAARFNVILP